MKPAKRINVRLMLAITAAILIALLTVFVVHRIQVHRNAEGLVALARARQAEGRGNDALGLFARYLSFRPNDASAQADFAKLLLARAQRPDATRGDRAMAYDAVESAVSKNPDDRNLRTALADMMLKSGRFGAAGQQLDILLRKARADASPSESSASSDEATTPADNRDELALMRARAYLGTGNYQEAADLLADLCGFDLDTKRFVSVTDDDFAPATETTATVYQATVFLSALLEEKLRDPVSGRYLLDHLIEMNPDDFRPWLARANWHRSHDAFDEAAADLAKASEMAPDDAGVLFTRFEVALAQRRLAEAEELVLKARELFPADERVYRGIAAVASRQGDLGRATAVLREALTGKLNDYYKLHLMLVEVLLQRGLLQEAEDAIASIIAKYGGDASEVGMLESRLLIAQRRWLPARKKLEAIRPLVATSTEMTNLVDLYLGQCHEQLGEFDEQLAANRRVLSEDHRSLMARIGAAAALAATGRPDEALVEYEAIAASLPPDQLAAMPQVWNALLQLRVAQQLKRPDTERDWSLADELLDLLEQSPQISATQMTLLKSDSCLRKGDSATAEQLLRTQLSIDPASAPVTAALMTLVLRTKGPAAARELLDAAPPEIAEDPLLMVVEAQMATRLPAEESAVLFNTLEAKADRMPDDRSGQLLANMGSIRRSTGSPTEAERLWTAALKKRPDDIPILTALLELACDVGDEEKAKATAAEIGRLSGQESPQGRVATASALALAVRQQQARRASESERAGTRRGVIKPTPQEAEQLTAAYNLLVEAENDRPGWVRIQKLFAEIAGLRGDPPEAIERLQRATRMGAADPAVLRQLLMLLYQSNRLEEAQQTLAQLGPEGISGLERLSAEIELSTGRFDDAVTMAERSVSSGDDASADDLVWFGQLLARAGKMGRATEVFQRAVAADPKRTEGWLGLLSSQVNVGQRQSAERTLERAFQALEPPRQQAVMAEGCEMLGRIDDAERSFREALAADPRSTAAARSLASFLVRRGRLAAARDELHKIIAMPREGTEADAVRTWARRALAVLLAQSGGYRDLEASLALLEQDADGGRLPTEDITLMFGILAARPEPGNWRRAIDVLDQLSKLQQLSTPQLIQRAQLLDQCGRWDEARNELVAIASRPTAPPTAQALLVEKLIQHGERDSAKIWLKKLAERTPGSAAVFALQAKLAVADNDRTAAAQAARKLMPDSETSPQPEQIGSVATFMEQLGFDKAADKVFEQYAAASNAGIIPRAAFLGRQHRVDEALDLLERRWDQLPLLPLMQTAVNVLRSQGTNASLEQQQRVVDWFVKAEREDPGSPQLKLMLADLQSIHGRDAAAAVIYRELLARDDLLPMQTAIVANNLAFLLAQPATAAEAETLIDAALAELGPSPDVLDTRGVVLLAAGKTRESIAILKEAVLAPTPAKYLHLACALAADRQLEEARSALTRAKGLGLERPTLCTGDRLRLASLESTLGM